MDIKELSSSFDFVHGNGVSMPRIIPVLQIQKQGAFKTLRFKSPKYVGDPINIVKLFSDMMVDELVVLDISKGAASDGPNFQFIEDLASVAAMPLAYGGGISSLEAMNTLFSIGVEKVVVGSAAFDHPDFIRRAAAKFGSQSVVVCIDVKRSIFGKPSCYSQNGTKKWRCSPKAKALEFASLGAGEIILQSIDRDGTRRGYDVELVQEICQAVEIPIIACGGANSLSDMSSITENSGAAGAAAGSMFAFSSNRDSVLVSYPSYTEISAAFGFLNKY